MRAGQAILSGFRKYAIFEGRSSRSEFWWFTLFLAIAEFLGQNVGQNWTNVDGNSFRIHFGLNFGLGPEFSWWTNLFTALCFIPFCALFARRLHDIGIHASRLLLFPFGLLALAMLILKLSPTADTQKFVLFIALLLFFGTFLFATLKQSQPGPNKYGPNPHEVPQ